MLLDETLKAVRIATRADNQLLVDLMADVPMQGSLVLSTRRDPDFFALYEMQKGSARAFVYSDDTFAGMGAILVRDGWLDGAPCKVGYLGDLRTRGTGRARRAFPSVFGHFFAESVAQTGCESYVTAVLASNAMAIQSLVRRRKRREAQPYYHLLRRYDMASVQMVFRPKVKKQDAAVDVSELAAFLHEDHKRRPFGYRFDDGELEHRLAKWPGFSLDDTIVVREGGKVVGCCTLWDAAPVKRYRVMRYSGDMRFIRAGLAVASKIIGCPALPKTGEDFRYLYLTNLSVRDDDPKILHALLQQAYARAWEKRVHFFCFPLYEEDRYASALDGFVKRMLPFHLYAVTSSEKPRTEWQVGRPGFELALA